MIEILQGAKIVEQRDDISFQSVGPQRLDDNLPIFCSLTAQKRDAEPAGAEDAYRLVLRRRERLESIGIEGDGAAQGRQRFAPIAAFQGGAVDVVMRLGLGDGIGDETGHFLKIALTRFEIADHDLQLGQAVEQGRQPPLLFDRQVAEALDEILHKFSFAVAAQGQPIARPHRTGVQIVTALQLHHRLVQIGTGLTVIVLFRLQIQHKRVTASANKGNDPLTIVGRQSLGD